MLAIINARLRQPYMVSRYGGVTHVSKFKHGHAGAMQHLKHAPLVAKTQIFPSENRCCTLSLQCQ